MCAMFSFAFFFAAFAADPTPANQPVAEPAKTVSSTVLISGSCPVSAVYNGKGHWNSEDCRAAEEGSTVAWNPPATLSETDRRLGYTSPSKTAIEACNRRRQYVLDFVALLNTPTAEKTAVVKPVAPRLQSPICVECRNAWTNQCIEGGYDGTDMCAQTVQANCAEPCRTF